MEIFQDLWRLVLIPMECFFSLFQLSKKLIEFHHISPTSERQQNKNLKFIEKCVLEKNQLSLRLLKNKYVVFCPKNRCTRIALRMGAIRWTLLWKKSKGKVQRKLHITRHECHFTTTTKFCTRWFTYRVFFRLISNASDTFRGKKVVYIKSGKKLVAIKSRKKRNKAFIKKRICRTMPVFLLLLLICNWTWKQRNIIHCTCNHSPQCIPIACISFLYKKNNSQKCQMIEIHLHLILAWADETAANRSTDATNKLFIFK